MSEFYVGQKVVCVDGSLPDYMGLYGFMPKKDEIYVVSAVDGAKWLNVREDDGQRDWRQNRFRPLETKDISLFRQIAQDITDGKHTIIPDDVPADLELAGSGGMK